MDIDGLGDDMDPDIDGDGVPNAKDDYPFDPFRSKLPEDPFPWLQVIILIMVLIIIAGAATLGYLVYNGTVKLPSSAPPAIDSDEVEFEEEGLKPAKGKADKDLEDLEDLENMSVCSACGELIPMEANTCPNCGVQFEEEISEIEEFEEDEE
jgi:ribosomal protein L32